MKAKDDPNYRTLRFILDLLSEDLDKLSSRDLSHLIVDTQYYFINQWPMFPLVGIPWIEDEAREKDTKVDFRFASGWPDDYPWKDTLEGIQEELKKIIEDIRKIEAKETKGVILENWKIGDVELRFGVGSQRVIAYNLIPGEKKKYYEPAELTSIAKMTLYRVLVRMPRGNIGVCQRCKKYFIRLIAKPKSYCSRTCQAVADTEKQRAKDPQKYRASQREYMKKKYREKKAKKLGIPVEQVTIRTYEDKEK